MHITLLGDSVFDNAVYTDGKPSVAQHLQERIGAGASVTLRAEDGSVTQEVGDQLPMIPEATTHLVISSGGNDALSYIEILSEPAGSVAEALDRFRAPLIRFELDYRGLLEEVSKRHLQTYCCTIYYGDFEPPMDTVVPIAVSLFNDVIYRVAGHYEIPVIELRRVCTEPADFAYSIEPSGIGGSKIAAEIASVVGDPT